MDEPQQGEPMVRFRSRHFVPGRGLGRGLLVHLRKRADMRLGAHVVIQFGSPPNLSQRRIWRRDWKLRLLDPIPDGAYFATIPPDVPKIRKLVGRGGIAQWVGAIEPTDKISPALIAGVPGHAMGHKGAHIVVQFFGDVPLTRQEAVLASHSTELEGRISEINGWLVSIRPNAIRGLARDDEVKWIEPIPEPAEADNDGVRGTTGVNADAVLAPTPAGLTGAGVKVGHWEPDHASQTHVDFTGRISLGDGPVVVAERSQAHDESVASNGSWDPGEAIYTDMDDSASVTPGDVRTTAVGAFAAGSVVAAGDADVGTALILFDPLERFRDNVTADGRFTPGEAIYVDADGSSFSSFGTVSVGDTRLTAAGGFSAGSIVAAGDSDIGQQVLSFPTNVHSHPTHVAGTVIGSGAGSAAQGGSPGQWKGVAPGASIRSYRGSPLGTAEYADAIANGVSISTNSWGTSHISSVIPPSTGYNAGSQQYDSIVSGRQSDGSASGLAQRVLIVGSAGNEGRPERHTENVLANGQFDVGESIYRDSDDNGVVSGADFLLSGPAQPMGTPLVNFNLDEMHTELPGVGGNFNAGEAIYRDMDGSMSVSVGDVRITAVAGFPAGSVVASGDADIGGLLRRFKLWGNVRIPNSAKNTVEVANITSDTAVLSPSSSRGPTDDGRTKPDVAGPGSQQSGDFGVTSTWPGNLYMPNTGTSMSTPAVSGVAALLREWYGAACSPAMPTPDVLRALLIHSAEDRTSIPNVPGLFTGPDFAFGYGRVRAKEAVELLPYHLVGSAAATGDTDRLITIGQMGQLRVTLVWDDPAWTPNAAPSPVTGILHNDLDLLLIAPDGTQHTPWVLDPANPGTPATRLAVPAGSPVPPAARDRRNTVEQIVVDNAMPGTWTIRVTASSLALPPQSYVLVSEAFPVQAGPCLGPAADVWMRDNVGDTGAEPSAGTLWLSPDVWNQLAPGGAPVHANPEYGQPNYLYANLRNASALSVASASVDFWIAPAATGLAWPASFRLVGRLSVANLAPGEVRQVGPLVWDPPSPAPSDHFCLYMRLQSPQDPITFAETSNVGSNAANSNNLVWRNVNVVDLMSSRSVTFLARHVGRKPAGVTIELTVAEELLQRGQVFLRLPPSMERMWLRATRKDKGILASDRRLFASYGHAALDAMSETHAANLGLGVDPPILPPHRVVEAKVKLPSMRFEPGQAEPITLTFVAVERLEGENEVDVIQTVAGRTVGGIRYLVRSGK